MARLTRRDWLITGIQLLAEQGVPALTIENLTNRLTVTKGSFYHHFKSFADYKTALLELYEQEGTLNVIELTEHQPSAAAKIDTLIDVVCGSEPILEIVLRAWALQDDEVRQVQARIDVRRITYLQEVYFALTGDETQALIRARLAYTIVVGSAQLQPPLPPAALRQLLNELTRVYQVAS